MEKDDTVKKIVKDAAGNVACETGVLSDSDVNIIIDQLKRKQSKSDESFILGLVRTLNKGENNGRKTK